MSDSEKRPRKRAAVKKPATPVRKTGTKPEAAVPPAQVGNEERRALVAQAAYYRAERRGFTDGHELEDWLAAEAEIELLLAGDRKPFRPRRQTKSRRNDTERAG